MANEREYYGHMTMADGSHVPLSKEDAEHLWKASEARQAEIAARWPDERSCLIALTEAFHRLRDFGWQEAIYCPKDGTWFQVIEPGSSGIHRAHYEGSWPKGTWWIEDGGDMWPSRPILFKLFPEDQAKYDAKMKAAAEAYAAETTQKGPAR